MICFLLTWIDFQRWLGLGTWNVEAANTKHPEDLDFLKQTIPAVWKPGPHKMAEVDQVEPHTMIGSKHLYFSLYEARTQSGFLQTSLQDCFPHMSQLHGLC